MKKLPNFVSFDLKKHQEILPKNGKVLVAPLDWGIGHATRCIPIIEQLINNNYTPIIAGNGKSLALLKKLFPDVKSLVLPAYDVRYAKNSKFFLLKLLIQIPKFLKTYRNERRIVADLVRNKKIDALISDNRFGVFHEKIPSIYITHQLRVKSGITTIVSTKIHQIIINKYKECWVPDVSEIPNLSGELSHNIILKKPPVYIGLLSQMKRQELPIKYDVLFLLSGPEPQRSLLESKILKEMKGVNKRICIIRGKIENEVKLTHKDNLTVYNYLLGESLNHLLNQSQLVVSRSGYSTLMDLAKLQKECFFIPTPGQHEQLYLATHLKNQNNINFVMQENFSKTQVIF